MLQAVFYVFAACAVLTAALCILSRTPLAAVLWLVTTMLSLAAIYVLLGAGDLYRTATRYSDQRIPNVMDVTAFIQDQANEGEAVLASWPGYLVGTDLDPVPGLENDFASDAAHSLTRDEAARYKVLSSGEIEAAIEGRRTRLAVFRQWHFPAVPIDWEGALRRGGYELVARFEAGDTEIGGPTLIFRVPSDA